MEVKEIFKNSDETALLLELEKILEKIQNKNLETPSQTLQVMNRKDKCSGVSRFAKQISDHEKA